MTSQTTQHAPEEQPDSLPFPYSQRPYCPYEPFEKRVKSIRVLVVNDLLRDESDLSDTARREWGDSAASKLERERYISGLAIDNIVNNIKRLVEAPALRRVGREDGDAHPRHLRRSPAHRPVLRRALRHARRQGAGRAARGA